ncbi:MAG: Methylcrotonyl-CoA carboxylase biotin-containing subunit [uncultured Sphingomonas sp.]|uniref:Methylcrotonyl-CoA carboxylase biotin-containing subunit n=1 Tax=uncultured Sphingomonas sp. TaxID=158754 RepID=A0A6J4T008_9SPHN|nr:acetyl/propionyl/methylcrotonyl-CoA carboxylase subunit alpha [uncultured Sphingomonas sp.]CAA9509527.1 MAG: Methylcrotonyl-CoA carboxylase biotin-containing subunit [uncultured Sphingomonas sp.]
MIASLLIANRGEIACRIIRSARKLGVRTVAVYSDADAKALHVRMADEAVHIGPSPARESYLVGERIIAAAKQTGAEAIHPGYGFLSENADFAQVVLDAGLVWVGPKPDSIRAMGLKDAAKTLMAEAGVPVTPGYLGEDQSPERLKAEADAIGYPVLIKAVAGGGGKGMRRVDEAAAFLDALDSCKREASSSFGNDIVLLEKYILSPRHIEVQVFGDSHGNVVHLFERDCSLQRRHQKVIEEAPAPGMDQATRDAVCAAAVRAAEAVNYEGAGTIEFIADASEGLRADRIWFMEMNTRLQVEHPVTEEITGQDLVEWQLWVASGEPLPKRQDELSITGHAIEARLYAEDPAKGFLPSVGRLEHFNLGDDGRIETGVEEGDAISPFYDPMIAKLVARAEDRQSAIGGLEEMLAQVEVWPVRTNAGFLSKVVIHENFKQARLDTGLIARSAEELTDYSIPDAVLLSAISWRLEEFMAAEAKRDAAVSPSGLFGFRLNGTRAPARLGFTLNGEQHFALVQADQVAEGWQWDVAIDGRTEFLNIEALPTTYGPEAETQPQGPILMFSGGHAYQVSFEANRGNVGHGIADGALIAPMPGKVTSVDVSGGEQVTKGQRLLTLEAMKMEHAMVAPFDGVVAELNVEAGAQVQVEAVLARVEASGE